MKNNNNNHMTRIGLKKTGKNLEKSTEVTQASNHAKAIHAPFV